MDEKLKAEFIKLKNENIISEDVYSKILNYYNNEGVFDLGKINLQSSEQKTESEKQQESANQTEIVAKIEKAEEKPKITEKPVKQKKKINFQLLLSIISSVLIAGGIISLIAYNWNAISRLAKSITAFVICVMSPVLYVVLTKIRKVEFEQKSKEFFSILWNALFGGSIAFVSQTYRMASNPVSFFMIWIIISIGITYALKSYSSFFISLLLIIVYSIYSQQFTCNVAVAFYPAMFLLFFFTKNNKKCFYIWLVELISLIGVVFEKGLPGLWIIAYVSIGILLLAYSEKENDKVCKIFGYIQAGALSIILAIPYFWKNIGFDYYRENALYNKVGSIVDYIVTFAVYSGSFAITICGLLKSAKNKINESFYNNLYKLIILFVIGASYFCCSFIEGFAVYMPRIIFLLYLLLFAYCIIHSKIPLSCISFGLMIYVIVFGEFNFILVLLLSALCAFNLLIQKKDISSSTKSLSISLIYFLLILLRIFFGQYCELFEIDFEENCWLIDLIISSAFLISTFAYGVVKSVQENQEEKKWFSKLSFGIATLFLSVLLILSNFNLKNIEIIFDVAFTVIAVLSLCDLLIYKSKNSYFGLICFVINYFIVISDSCSCLFVLAILFLFSFAVHFYLDEKTKNMENYSAVYSIPFCVLTLAGYFISYNAIFEEKAFNPFGSPINSVLFVILLGMTFALPVVKFIRKQCKLGNLTSLAVAIVSVVFAICGGTVKFFTLERFIYLICVLTLLTGSFDFILKKERAAILNLCSSLVICFAEYSLEGNTLNGIVIMAIVIFAAYYYSMYFTQDKASVKITITALYTLLIFVAFCLDCNESIENYGVLTLFSTLEKTVCTIIFIPVLLGIPIFKIIKNREIHSLSSIAITVVAVAFFFLNGYLAFFDSENFLFIMSFVVLIFSFIDCFIFNQKSTILLFVLSLFEMIRKSAVDNGITIYLIISLLLFSLLIYSRVLAGEKKFVSKFTTFVFSVFMLVLLCKSYDRYDLIDSGSNLIEYYVSISSLLLFNFAIPCFYMIKNKIKINYMEIGFVLELICLFVLFSVCDVFNYSLINNIFGNLSLLLIIGFSIFGLYFSYEKASLKSANYYLIFLCLCFVIRFFMISNGLIERGIVCIVCGICILVVNMLFSKKVASKAAVAKDEKNEN